VTVPDAETIAHAVVETSTGVDLDARYGRTPGNERRNRVIAVVTGIGFTVVVVAWLVWGGLLGGNANLEAVDAGHVIHSDSSVTVKWSLTVPPGTPTKCAIEAMDEGYGVVGWKIVDVPASDRRIRTMSEDLRTMGQAVTGLIYRCWLT
jgi:Domain of unknown function (DUF4307)